MNVGMSSGNVMVACIPNRVFCFVYLSRLPSPPPLSVFGTLGVLLTWLASFASFRLLLLSSALLACLLALVWLIGLHTFLNPFGPDLEHRRTPEPCNSTSAAAFPSARDRYHQHERLSEFVTLSHR